MQQHTLPLLHPLILRKLQSKRHSSSPPLHSLTSACAYLPTHDVSLIQQINRAKTKVHFRKTSSKSRQIVSLQDSIDQNKKFSRQLKFLLHRSKNPELIAAISKKKIDKIPRFQIEKESSFEHMKAVEELKRKVEPKWKLYTKRRRIEEGFSLRDSFMGLGEEKEWMSAKSIRKSKTEL